MSATAIKSKNIVGFDECSYKVSCKYDRKSKVWIVSVDRTSGSFTTLDWERIIFDSKKEAAEFVATYEASWY